MMFTGIIQAVGRIARCVPDQGGANLLIDAGNLSLQDVAAGDSIAVSGICLTVTALVAPGFEVYVSRETLACTTGLDRVGNPVNLEKALRLADRLGGHLVSGHVDGIAEVVSLSAEGASMKLTLRPPQALSRYIAPKGSVTLNGVSLTVNTVVADVFSINVIPHTLDMTTLRTLTGGDGVNLEVDMMARYVERILTREPTV